MSHGVKEKLSLLKVKDLKITSGVHIFAANMTLIQMHGVEFVARSISIYVDVERLARICKNVLFFLWPKWNKRMCMCVSKSVYTH